MTEHRTPPSRSWDASEPTPTVQVPPSAGIAAGSSTEVTATVTNTAASPRVLSVVALGVDPTWTGGPVRTEALAPGASAVVSLLLSPPSGTFPAQYPLVVTVQAVDPASGRPVGGSPAGMAETTLVVDPRTQLSLELAPAEMSVVASRRFAVVLRNDGALPASVRLTDQSTRALHVRLPRQVVVPARGSARVRGRVRVKKPRFIGYSSEHHFTVTARGTEAVRYASGSVRQRSVVGPVGAKATALLLVLAVWIAAAVVFLPPLTDWIASSGESSVATQEEGGAGTEEGAGDDGAGGAGSEDGAGAGDDQGGAGAADGPGASDPDKLQLTGTVAGEEPDGVSVHLEPTSLVDEELLGGVQGVGVSAETLDRSGMRPASAFLPTPAERTEPERTVTTAADGSWAFPAVRRPGYYLLTFSKPGFQEQRFVVDSQTAVAEEPLEVDLAPAEGAMSGTITDPRGPVGGATITISDGLNTVTTSSDSRGRVGHWAVTGLSTPGTYVVEARQHDLTSEARVIDLAAGGELTRADLTLRRGVRSLVGRVDSRGFKKDAAGVGGLQVSVSDDAGRVRTATTLTGSRVRAGRYVVPDLPVPGTYTVSVSGDGYQTETHTVRLVPRGEPHSEDFHVTVAAGQVHGRVRLASAPPTIDAGLTLTNNDHTYKTATDDSGNYTINGVVPGDYTLTFQRFRYQTDQISVTVTPGPRLKPVNRTLTPLTGDGFPAQSTVRGSAADHDGFPLDCGGVPSRCTATVVHPQHLDEDGDPDLFRTTFEPNAAYVLPPNDAKGLLSAGLHTVEVSAPGYESARVRVEVSENEVAEAPVARLFPAPRVSGDVRSGLDGTALDACVWVLDDAVLDPATDLPKCQGAIDKAGTGAADRDVCLPGRTSYDATTVDPTPPGQPYRTCAATVAGRYDIQVPAQGTYFLYVAPLDHEYAGTDAARIDVARAQQVEWDVSIKRLGRVDLTVLVPGPGESLVPAPDGTQVTLNPPAARTPDPTVDGRTLVTGLAQRAYTASVERGDGHGGTGRVQVNGIPNATEMGFLRLTDPIRAVVGRVSSQVDDAGADVTTATVVVEAPVGYDGVDAAGQAYYGSVTVDSGGDGCFAIAPTGERTAVDSPGADCDSVFEVNAFRRQAFVSNHAKRVIVSAPGYETLVLDKPTTPADPPEAGRTYLRTDAVNTFHLDPLPVEFSGTITTDPEPTDNGDVAWGDIDFTVTTLREDHGAFEITAQSGADQDLGTAVLSFTEAGVPAGRILPGTYEITARLDNHEDATTTLTCAVVTPCTLAGDELVLVERGTVTVRTGVQPGGSGTFTPVTDASVVLKRGSASQLPVAGSTPGEFTFTGLTPGANTDIRFTVAAAGHASGTTRAVANPAGDEVRLDCPPGNDERVDVVAGSETVCKLLLTPLGSVDVTVTGVLGPLDASPRDTRALPGAAVTVTACTSWSPNGTTCLAVDPTRTFTGTTGPDGTVVVTGTLATEGLRDDVRWLVSATADGYDAMPGPRPGRLVRVDHGTVTDVGLDLFATEVDVRLHVLDNHDRTVTDATVRLSQGGTVLTADKTDTGDDTRYHLDGVLPGRWSVAVTGPGLGDPTVTLDVEPSADGSAQLSTIDVTRGSATVQGVVSEDPAGTLPVAGATVFLRCATTATSARCPATGPALGTGLGELTATTSGAGGYAIADVPVGTAYTTHVTRRGFADHTGATHTYAAGDSVTDADLVLVPVTHPVTVTIEASHADEELGGVGLTLVPVGDTPGGPLALSPPARSADGSKVWRSSLAQVRWGCWKVQLTMPAGHLATPSGPTGSPSDTHVTCSDVTVPTTPDASTVTLTYDLDAGRMVYDLTTTPQPGNDVPLVDLSFVSGGFRHDVAAASPGSRELWLPPGEYTVTAQADGVPATFWPQVVRTVTVGASGSVDVPLPVEELTAAVTVRVTGLAAGEEASIAVVADPGQDATSPYSVPVTTVGGEVVLQLPAGPWVIHGAWPAGPNQSFLDVTDRTHLVELEPIP